MNIQGGAGRKHIVIYLPPHQYGELKGKADAGSKP